MSPPTLDATLRARLIAAGLLVPAADLVPLTEPWCPARLPGALPLDEAGEAESARDRERARRARWA